MHEPITRENGITYNPLDKTLPLPEGVRLSVYWAQKTHPTLIYRARFAESLNMPSGERQRTMPKGNEIIFDNGKIPYLDESGKTAYRHDAYIPTDSSGTPTGKKILNERYDLIFSGVGVALTYIMGMPESDPRDYGYYLPKPAPSLVVEFQGSHYIPDAFGPGDHQFLTNPVFKVEEKDGDLFIKSGINGPEFKHTWTVLARSSEVNEQEAMERAQDALRKARRAFLPKRILYTLQTALVRTVFFDWTGRRNDLDRE